MNVNLEDFRVEIIAFANHHGKSSTFLFFQIQKIQLSASYSFMKHNLTPDLWMV